MTRYPIFGSSPTLAVEVVIKLRRLGRSSGVAETETSQVLKTCEVLSESEKRF